MRRRGRAGPCTGACAAHGKHLYCWIGMRLLLLLLHRYHNRRTSVLPGVCCRRWPCGLAWAPLRHVSPWTRNSKCARRSGTERRALAGGASCV